MLERICDAAYSFRSAELEQGLGLGMAKRMIRSSFRRIDWLGGV